jgi:NADPH2:quinone reductase
MRFIGVTGAAGPEVMVVQEGPAPVAGDGEVLIQVQAAGINRPDILQRMGRYPVPPGASPVMGLEVAGIVAALGAGVTEWQVVDPICALVNGGGYAEFCAAPAVQCLPWPEGYTAVQAAGLPETFFTVWANLFGHGLLDDGEWVLIHGGTSGIGTTAVALAREFGARVIVTAGSAEKCAASLALGAQYAIDYKTQDFVTEVARITAGRGVDVVLDMVAGSYLSRNVNCLAKDGRLVVIATQGGFTDPDFNILPVMMKRLVITGSTMRPRTRAEKGEIADALAELVWPVLNAGRCAPIIHATFPLAEVAAAHRMMQSGAHVGKIVLTVGT